MTGRPVPRHASGGTPDPWRCCGCGNELLPDGTTGCDCATVALFRQRDDKCAVKCMAAPIVERLRYQYAHEAAPEEARDAADVIESLIAAMERALNNPQARVGGHIRAEMIAAIRKARGDVA